MVGLPARGKTYISKKLTRYLNWIGMPTKGMLLTEIEISTVSGHHNSLNAIIFYVEFRRHLR